MQNASCSYRCIVIAWNQPHLNILITWVNQDELIEILNLFSIVDFPQELIFLKCILFVNVVHFTVTCYWPHDPMWKLQTYDMYIDHNTLCFACNCNCNNWPCEFYEKYYWNIIEIELCWLGPSLCVIMQIKCFSINNWEEVWWKKNIFRSKWK